CTACHTARYFSHRAQGGRAGRQAGLIWLPR
ncbi:MAG: laccase domain-containing protein, partial [Firmicutes bacterium]|nr:laccase domain-containing protein [Bacillota bacterium]